MKKLLSLLIVTTIGASLLVGCKKENYANTLEKIQKTKEIVIGIDASYPPMEFKDGNETVGFDIDMANAIAEKMGVKAKFVNTQWTGIFTALKSKKFDLIQSSVSQTPDREKEMLFSKPYVYGGAGVFVKKGNTSINNSDDLKGKVVGCQAGTTANEVLDKLEGLKEVKKYDDMTDAFLDLQTGRLDAVASDPMVGDYYVSKQSDKYDRVKSTLVEEPIGVAFRIDDTELRDAYDKAIDEVKADGTLSKLSVKWFGYDIYNK